jgi:hypothetical protein
MIERRLTNGIPKGFSDIPRILAPCQTSILLTWWMHPASCLEHRILERGFSGPDGDIEVNGYWGVIIVRQGEDWKFRMLTVNITPPPPATDAGAP